jgi:prevent-host-death family protein
MTWQLQEAKARFSEFLDASLREGPQIVTRHGKEEAVLVPIAEWRRLQVNKPTLKELLLAPCPTVEDMMIPKRGQLRRRKPLKF